MQVFLPALKIRQGEPVHYSFQEEIAELLPDYGRKGTLAVRIAAISSGEKVMIRGTLETAIEETCSRCLEPFKGGSGASFEESFTVAGEPVSLESPRRQAERSANELTVSGDYLYLHEYIRQQVILAGEYRPLCSPGCRGICPGCGVDLNRQACLCREEKVPIDVRLLKLKELNLEDQ